MLIQQTLIQYLLQKKNLCEIFKVLTIWGNINLFIRPQHQQIIKSKGALSDYVWQSSFVWLVKNCWRKVYPRMIARANIIFVIYTTNMIVI